MYTYMYEYFILSIFMYEYLFCMSILFGSECDNWIRTKIIQQHAENWAALFPIPSWNVLIQN